MRVESSIWLVDGMYKVTPSIFTQVFTVLGVWKRNAVNDENVTRFLEWQHDATVCRGPTSSPKCTPANIMSDFELDIINARRDIFPNAPVKSCVFHVGQAVYQGLQEAYNNSIDGTLKIYAHGVNLGIRSP